MGKSIEQYYNVEPLVESIKEYVLSNSDGNSVSLGDAFCKWVLLNLFQLRDDEATEAKEIGGCEDNGIDAVFEINEELYIIQTKYETSHSTDGMLRFKEECIWLAENKPTTSRQVVKEGAAKIRDYFEKNEKVNCFYITNNIFNTHEAAITKDISRDLFSFQYLDLYRINSLLIDNVSSIPLSFKNKSITLLIGSQFIESNNTLIAMVSLKDFADFVNKGQKYLFNSNIRHYLNKTKINKGIESTLEATPQNFWFYNNGVTIVCESFEHHKQTVKVNTPQIVNGCQTANSIAKIFRTKSDIEKNSITGHLLVKLIKTNSKETRNDITRYTNSQNSVKGLDFYSLDNFQIRLQGNFTKLGYYYEIQRGAFNFLKSHEKLKYFGCVDYDYLTDSKFNNVLPAKEVIQAYTSAFMQNPALAYGRANELTPIGDSWKDIFNEETLNRAEEHFLYPYLVLYYCRNKLGYKHGANNHRKSASLLFVYSYFKFLQMLFSQKLNMILETPLDVEIKYYKYIMNNKAINERILTAVDNMLEFYFRDSTIRGIVSDDLKNFLKVKIKQNEPLNILLDQIKFTLKDQSDLMSLIDLTEV